MPMFEYRCDGCQTRSEILILAGDVVASDLSGEGSGPVCPKCGSESMQRLLSTFAARSTSGGAAGFDPSTACGGGPCRTPDMCGGGMGGFDN
ncbi:MAG: zinc ribbon domain-containing protein [Acidobacteria bacterium]|nr:zinc ribbon domain-containing protein [Acidobacteriota bacterium]